MLKKLRSLLSSTAFYFLLAALPLGTRKLLHQFTPGFQEYEAAFFYLSDIFLLLVVGLFFFGLFTGRRRNSQFPIPNFQINSKFQLPNYLITQLLLIAVFLLAAFGSVFFAYSKGLAIYNFIRLVLSVSFAFAVGSFVRGRNNLARILAVIAALAAAQSLIGFLQFRAQGNLGLKFLGESPISITDGGTSKIVIDGVRVIRAYGTFPHPNILAAFLLLGLISLCYLYLKNDQPLYAGLYDRSKSIGDNFRRFLKSRHLYFRLLLAAGIFLVPLGLVLTFSRSAWAIGILSLIVLVTCSLSACPVGRSLVAKSQVRPLLRLSFLLVACYLSLVAVLGWAIFPRAQISPSEPAVSYRLAYNKLGLDLAKNHPFGVGIGNQVLHSVRNGTYQQFGMDKVWQWQPIHNLYLLVAAEIGWLGFLGFIGFLAVIIWQNFKNRLDLERLTVLLLLGSLLAFGLADHFLWTIEQGRLIMWLAIGLAFAQVPAIKQLGN